MNIETFSSQLSNEVHMCSCVFIVIVLTTDECLLFVVSTQFLFGVWSLKYGLRITNYDVLLKGNSHWNKL